jgi:DNA-binding GntR family transcriptional regulator
MEPMPDSRTQTIPGRDLSLKRMSLPEALADSLRERIISGEFHEGDQIRQETVAGEYKVSRMPVREALRQLEASGLVELQTHKGAVVKILPLAEIAELFDLRVLLECDVLRRAVPQMTDADLQRSSSLLAQLEAAYEKRDIAAWGAMNSAYHESLYAPSGRTRSLAMIRILNMQTDRYIRMQLVVTRAIARAEEDHREILRLCQARETDEVVRFLEQHIRSARQDLVEMVKERRGA